MIISALFDSLDDMLGGLMLGGQALHDPHFGTNTVDATGWIESTDHTLYPTRRDFLDGTNGHET